MKSDEAPLKPGKANILDKIAVDPEMINRDLAHAKVPLEAKAVVATESSHDHLPEMAEKELAAMARTGEHAPVLINLLPEKVIVAEVVPRKSRRPLVIGSIVVGLALVDAGIGALALASKWRAQPVAQVAPTPTPKATASSTPTPTISPSPSPTPTPTPAPASTPKPETVTAPVVAPTKEKPQAVTITSKSGLWLRSSADSSDRGNIVGWMPNGAVVNVDQVGDFWWHGTYKGQTGYFASKYTQ